MHNIRKLRDKLCSIPGASAPFSRTFFHQVAIKLPRPAHDVVDRLAQENSSPGFALGEEFPEFENVLLVCATETKTDADLDHFVDAMKRVSS
jgi:glycine dehydrogenase subunit 1